MTTYQHIDDVEVFKFPRTETEWKESPTIEIYADAKIKLNVKDRIFMTTKMVTTGLKSGGVVNIYYYITGISDVTQHPDNENLNIITATAKRLEL